MIRKATQVNEHVARARHLSYILNSAQRNQRNSDYISGNRTSMENFVYKLSAPELGQIPCAKLELGNLQKQFEILSQAAINSGKLPLLEWPSELQEKRDMWSAKLLVHEEELLHVESELKKIDETTTKVETKLLPRSSWGSGRLSGGQLCEIGGFRVEPDASGILCIADDRCDFNGMPVWRFQSEVVVPIHREESYRLRLATKAAIESGRPRKAIARAKTPIWDREQDRIEYPDYSDAVLKKLKIQK